MLLNPDHELILDLIRTEGVERANRILNTAHAITLVMAGVAPELGVAALKFMFQLAERTLEEAK